MGQTLRRFAAFITLGAAACIAAAAAGVDDFEASLEQGAQWRRAGQTHQALALLTTASAAAATPSQRMRAAAELGLTLAQQRRFNEARAALIQAHELARDDPERRAAYALELGRLANREQDGAAAARYLAEAERAGDARISLAATLNLVQARPAAERLPALQALAPAVFRQGDAALLAGLGHQARAAGATDLAWRSWEQARRNAAPGSRTHLEAFDRLADLYETQGRHAEALSLGHAGLAAVAGQPIAGSGELAINMEWRNARLYKASGQTAAALAAYQRAADRLEALRADIAIELDDGSSSYQRWFEPIYLGLAESLLDTADALPPERHGDLLRRARDAVELLRQTEMQDFLGDRCAVDAVKGGTATVIPPGTAVIYTVLLPQRLELLVETAEGLRRVTQPVTREELRQLAARFAAALRNQSADFLALSHQLHERLLRPLEPLLAELHADTLVVVPDGALRMLPFGALHDGQRFAIEKYALGSVAGMTMTNTTPPQDPMTEESRLLSDLESHERLEEEHCRH